MGCNPIRTRVYPSLPYNQPPPAQYVQTGSRPVCQTDMTLIIALLPPPLNHHAIHLTHMPLFRFPSIYIYHPPLLSFPIFFFPFLSFFFFFFPLLPPWISSIREGIEGGNNGWWCTGWSLSSDQCVTCLSDTTLEDMWKYCSRGE